MDLHNKFSQITSLSNNHDLSEVIAKRFTTSFIGSLASIEELFYDLFTEEEWNRYWPELRENILNKANREKRLALKELEKYDCRRRNKNFEKGEKNYNK